MEEELLRQILQELQDQSGTSWLDFLQLMIPAIVGLVAGILGAGVGIYSVKRSTDSQLETLRLTTKADVDKISLERRLDLRRDRYMELQDALAEYIAVLERVLDAQRLVAAGVFRETDNVERYQKIYASCRDELEEIRSSGRLSQSRLKIGNQQIGGLVLELAEVAEVGYIQMIEFSAEAIRQFKDSGKVPGNEDDYWPEDHEILRAQITRKTHEISEMIEERISLSD